MCDTNWACVLGMCVIPVSVFLRPTVYTVKVGMLMIYALLT
jgi:hypothetical protein